MLDVEQTYTTSLPYQGGKNDEPVMGIPDITCFKLGGDQAAWHLNKFKEVYVNYKITGRVRWL